MEALPKQTPIQAVIVAPEMTTLIGIGDMDGVVLPAESALLVYNFGGVGTPATLRIAHDAAVEPLGEAVEGPASISFVVTHEVMGRLFGWDSAAEHGRRYHLTSEQRAIGLALRDYPAGTFCEAYRTGKSIELLCETGRLLASGELIPVAADGVLSLADSRRLVDARRIIDERWSEKLTLDGLARACGINRAKLTRGFRELYHCTVAEALAERRLAEASRRLLSTDLPVSKIGYESGYLNNASFARAFGRRFGVSPSEYRGRTLAA
ncbi:AraC family transcriptional regulator [Sphingomonas alpina]|uniref:Helix-turn-helix transcriptional regulator n=1 Tax=Sphingomonas alpina TaxID=653931 RepID=A0A7H0LQ20_9SPHN|nr:AraC family transcriptional regulator [Sphingomonas alpina]QNQ11773.1 helix-turn-helix transcriptional regulator [Sphingomonas alpina]